ncbi:DoxX family protein [Pigmentiphaga aceris]|uniref:DoxX family protein n=1 Tax=Pigmentiphaga aceris TaxID=1940612 RepID=A0A5C0ATY2_9BURK|nr:DoxX family protein [Pigmentiphaga aceris]QEI05839.1 DoxX family protein [Pigmentiphaga aceris]
MSTTITASRISSTSATSTNGALSATIPLIARLMLAAIFIVSGAGKIAEPAGTLGYITSVGLPVPMLAYIAALAVEIVGGLLLVVGYRTRVVAAVLAVFSVISALAFHHALGDQNQLFHFLKNIALAGGLLQVVAFGAGTLSLDARRGE